MHLHARMVTRTVVALLPRCGTAHLRHGGCSLLDAQHAPAYTHHRCAVAVPCNTLHFTPADPRLFSCCHGGQTSCLSSSCSRPSCAGLPGQAHGLWDCPVDPTGGQVGQWTGRRDSEKKSMQLHFAHRTFPPVPTPCVLNLDLLPLPSPPQAAFLAAVFGTTCA